jgi:hypothetical protein
MVKKAATQISQPIKPFTAKFDKGNSGPMTQPGLSKVEPLEEKRASEN